ncbi:MAG TPA: ABC transporter permease [Vicinamibacteria bacterium]|nr:ABC transporter permease [Vicinamibacteria bacterium]
MKLLELLLKLYPQAFRDRFRMEILAFIESDRTLVRGRARRSLWWVRTMFDLVLGASRLRIWERRFAPKPPRRVQAMGVARDVVLGLRSLGATPLVSAVIVATLAIGIGMSAAIFSVVETVLLDPLDYREPERLAFIKARWVADGVEDANHSGMDFERIRESAETFEDVAAVFHIRQNLTGTEIPLQVEVGWTSSNLFEILGVSFLFGSGFTSDAPPGTLVLSHHLWLDAFGGEEDIIGRVVRLDDHPYTISGVLPRGFTLHVPRFPTHVDVWKVPDDWWQNGDLWSGDDIDVALFDLVGRLAEGRTFDEAQAEMDSLASRFREQRVDFARAGGELVVVPLLDAVVGDASAYLYMLLGAVGLVLLTACANVMNLMLARGQARQREIALRLALGSSRLGIVRMMLVESLLVALAGGSLGLGLAWVATETLIASNPAGLPRITGTGVDPMVLSFVFGISVGSTLIFGVIPALASTRRLDPRDVKGDRVEGDRRKRMTGLVVAIQIAVSLVLWIGAGLLTKSFARLAAVEPGFTHENILTFSLSLPGTKYERPEGTDRFFRDLEERIEALPGAASAGLVWPLPLSHRAWSNTYAAGSVRETDRAYADYRVATPGFFETIGIELLDGNSFTFADARHVAIVDRTLADRAFPGESAVGRTVLANPWGGGAEVFEIIGVVSAVRYADLRDPARDTIYFDSRGWSWTDWEVDFTVRTGGLPPESLAAPIRETLASMDPVIPISRVRPLSGYVDDTLAENRFALMLIGLFAAVAGVLASVGLYGLVSYSVARRAREIGIRIAVGAGRGRIFSWVYRESLVLVLLGVVGGLLAAYALTRYLASLLFDVVPTDGFTFAAMATAMVALSLVACYAPARRATALDPLRVLRSE